MKQAGIIAIASVAALATIGVGVAVFAQDEKGAEETVHDYSEEPSAVAARDALEVINQLNTRKESSQDESSPETQADVWPAQPDVADWAGHYLVLQGENYLPIRQAFATPVVTLYSLEAGYMPHGPFSKLEGNDVCANEAESVDANGAASISSSMAADAAEAAGASVSEADRLGLIGCPKRLGTVWGSGSYVVDENGENIAGQDFSEGVKIFHGTDFLLDQQENDGDFLVVFEGGAKRMGDPAISPLPWPRAVIVDYPVAGHAAGATDGWKEDPYFQPAPDLPVTIWPGVVMEAPGNPDPALIPLDELLDALDVAIRNGLAEDESAEPEFLLVHRADPAFDAAEVLERLRQIRNRVRQYGKVRTVSFGQEAPICADDTDRCWSVNRSSILYRVK